MNQIPGNMPWKPFQARPYPAAQLVEQTLSDMVRSGTVSVCSTKELS